MPSIDITGQRFGRLVVIRNDGSYNDGHSRWLCRCDCGKVFSTALNRLRRGSTKSCGCLRSEILKQPRKEELRRNIRIYRIWYSMRNRCSDKLNKYYGAKGIAVCQAWQQFEPFRDWALANGYADHLTIDRRENDKGYEPGNCRWATRKEQANNRGSA